MVKIEVKGPIVSNDSAWIYDWIGWDCTSPNKIKKALEEAAGEDIELEINSPGGVCVYGYEMYTALMQYEGRVTANVICAMSAATLLVCAADKALISDTGIFMIHNTKSSADGDYRDMQMEADALREFNEGLINAYVRKTNLSREEIQTMMDNETYMSPASAIEKGFIDDYMFGNPDNKAKTATAFAKTVVAAGTPIIAEDKLIELTKALKLIETGEQKEKEPENMAETPEVAPVQQQNTSNSAVSDTNKQTGGEKEMTLQEILAENPEAKEEFDRMLDKSRKEGETAEKARIQSLDAIANSVTKEALTEAKYGKNPVDGQTLAYQAMVNGNKLAEAYAKAAVEDSKESGAEDVKSGNPDTGEEKTDESDEMAGYVNRAKGGK